jgi:hypothetical protein
MALSTTLNTRQIFQFLVIWWSPHFQTPVLSMTNGVAFSALNDVFLPAVFGLMTNFVTFKTHLFTAIE